MNKTKAFYITITTLLSIVCIAGIILLSSPNVQANLIKNSNEYNEILDLNSNQNNQISDLNLQIETLNKEIEKLDNQIKSLKTNLSNLETERNNFETLYNQGLISLEEKDNAILALNDEISLLNNEISSKTSQIETLQANLLETENERNYFESLYNQEKLLNQEKNNEITALEEQVNNLSLQFSSLYETKTQLDSQIESLNQQIAVMEENALNQSQYLETLIFERQELINQKNELTTEITELNSQIIELNKEINNLKNSVYDDARFTTLEWGYMFEYINEYGLPSTRYIGDYSEDITTKMHIEEIKHLMNNYQTITYGALCGLEVNIPLNNTMASTKIFSASDDRNQINDAYKSTFANVNLNAKMHNGYGYDTVNIEELNGFYNVRFNVTTYGFGNSVDTLELSFILDVI